MDLGAPDIRSHYVRLTNNGKEPFTDMHDGVPVKIMPGDADNFPLDMAAHFFGYGLDVPRDVMFRHTCKRQGWNTPKHLVEQPSGKTLAEELFGALEIRPVIYRMVEEKDPDLDRPIPADPDAVLDRERTEMPALPKARKTGAA
jgi:hypothetical protein